MSFYEPYKNGCLVKIKLAPNASVNAFGAEVYIDANGNEYLKASVVTVPEKGKANKELIKMLAKKLKIAVSGIEIIAGQSDHFKKIFINMEYTKEAELKLSSLKKEK